jgi:hypothetical protein
MDHGRRQYMQEPTPLVAAPERRGLVVHEERCVHIVRVWNAEMDEINNPKSLLTCWGVFQRGLNFGFCVEEIKLPRSRRR